jgi:hypothetical protein
MRYDGAMLRILVHLPEQNKKIQKNIVKLYDMQSLRKMKRKKSSKQTNNK